MVDLERMRANFALLTADRQRHQDWTEADVAELGAAIRAAMDRGDAEAVSAWADYLHTEAAPVRAMAQTCREAEARIRAQCAAEREREA